MQILKLDGLCKQYPAFRLENVSFSMEAGTIMGLIGRNGAGKTTTLKSMLHLVHPDAGTVTICGLDMDKDEREIRSRIDIRTACGVSRWTRASASASCRRA